SQINHVYSFLRVTKTDEHVPDEVRVGDDGVRSLNIGEDRMGDRICWRADLSCPLSIAGAHYALAQRRMDRGVVAQGHDPQLPRPPAAFGAHRPHRPRNARRRIGSHDCSRKIPADGCFTSRNCQVSPMKPGGYDNHLQPPPASLATGQSTRIGLTLTLTARIMVPSAWTRSP